jgi:serine phosphatase RsbU (regulator of sigma subunit)
MSLRLRLIVAFFLLSVVPVGAVTYYMYANNAQAIREAAGVEAEALAQELSQRMRAVTTQLSQRVETLVDLPPAPDAPPATVARTRRAPAFAAPPAAPAPPPPPAAADPSAPDFDLKLGDFAEMLKNIEIRGMRAGARRFGPGPDGRLPGRPEGGAVIIALPPNRIGTSLPTPAPPGATSAPAAGAPAGSLAGSTAPPGSPPAGPGGPFDDAGRRVRFGPPPDGRGPGGELRPDDPADPNRIRIDMRQIRQEFFNELVADRDAFDALPLEEKQKVFALIEQRMAGVAQGITVLQKELSSRAGDAQTRETAVAAAAQIASAAKSASAAASASAPSLATPVRPTEASPASRATPTAPERPTAAAPARPPVARKAPAPPAPPAAKPRMKRSTELSGQRLAVKVERDGQIVGQVNADVDLTKLLATIFAGTARERGELPFAVGAGGELYTATPSAKQQLEGLRTSAISASSKPGTTVLPDWIVATTPDPTGSGLKFGIARPVGDALVDLRATSARNAGLGLGFIGLALILIVPLSAGLTRNLDTLSAGVRRIADGDYSARVPVRSKDEMGRLAVAFNKMAADVEEHQRAAVSQERIRRELELGRQIQHDMLPQGPLMLGLTEIKGVSVPAREVGGDFFNYFQLRDGRIALLVGDVSGKGVGAALLMANLQAALRTRLALGQDLASLAQELDVDIDRTTPGPVYATLFVGILDPATRRLRCVNAGHNPQYVLRTDGRLERMESTGRPIGLLSGGGYTEQVFDLAAGDVLFFYTDGCVEAENASGDMFGWERLEQALAGAAALGADAVMAKVEADVSGFRAGVELQDDATMMVVKVG